MYPIDDPKFAPLNLIESIRSAVLGYKDAFEPYQINLTDANKPGQRTMAEGREGYARLVSQIATNHIDSIARELDPVELSNMLEYDSQLSTLYFGISQLLEVIEEARTKNGINAMALVDNFVGNLQDSRKNKGALDTAMREVDDWNKRFGARPNATPDVPNP